MTLNWYPFFVVDYRRDTYHLTLAEEGAYRRLIDEYMLTREPLPNDDVALARILALPSSEWTAIAPRIRKFFRLRADRLHHKRCDQELRAQTFRDRRLRVKAKKAASTRAKNNKHLSSSRSDESCTVVSPSSQPPDKIQVRKSEAVVPRASDDWPADYREVFWGKYPHKVGKADAMAKLERARGKVTWTELISGLDRYIAKTDDRPWCNPATWIHQDRWADQPSLFNGGRNGGHKQPDRSVSAAGDRILERLRGLDVAPSGD